MDEQEGQNRYEQEGQNMDEQEGQNREAEAGDQRERQSGRTEEQAMGFNYLLGNTYPPHEAPSSDFICEDCHEILKSAKLLKRHRQKHQGVSFQCDRCENSFTRK